VTQVVTVSRDVSSRGTVVAGVASFSLSNEDAIDRFSRSPLYRLDPVLSNTNTTEARRG